MFYDGSSEEVVMFLFECVNAGKRIRTEMLKTIISNFIENLASGLQTKYWYSEWIIALENPGTKDKGLTLLRKNLIIRFISLF